MADKRYFWRRFVDLLKADSDLAPADEYLIEDSPKILRERVRKITGLPDWKADPARSLETLGGDLDTETQAREAHEADAANPHATTAAQVGAIPATEKGSANGVAPLGPDTKIPGIYIPPVAISQPFPAAGEAEMLALDAQRGDVAIRADINRSFILSVEPASVLSNWMELLTPPDAVLSVNGQTGAVSLGPEEVGAKPASYVPAWAEVSEKPETFPPETHETMHDLRYVRTVNGTGPDANGDVAVEGGTGGDFGTVMLREYVATTDIAAPLSTGPNGTWTNLGPSNSFTVGSSASIIEIIVSGMCVTSSDVECAGAILLDGAGRRLFGGGFKAPNYLGGTGHFIYSGLSAGNHSVQVQITSNTAASAYCRAGTQPNLEALRVTVLERRQG